MLYYSTLPILLYLYHRILKLSNVMINFFYFYALDVIKRNFEGRVRLGESGVFGENVVEEKKIT